jgi:hypothetical protein
MYSNIDKAWIGGVLSILVVNAPNWFGVPIPPEVMTLIQGTVVGAGIYMVPNKK